MATHADAELILKLYDLRREPVMRTARATWLGWWPVDGAEAKAASTVTTLEINAYIRQVTSYWEMAFSLSNQCAIDSELFARNCGEGILSVLKCQHLAAKYPGDWTRKMPEGEAFIASSVTATTKAASMQSRFAGK